MKSDYETDDDFAVNYADLTTYEMLLESVRELVVAVVVIAILGAPIVYCAIHELRHAK